MGVADGLFQRGHTVPAQALIIGGLWLDGGYNIAQGVDEALVELENGVGGPLQGLAELFIGRFADVLRHILGLGVQPHHCGVFHTDNFLLQYIKGHRAHSPSR